MRSRAKLARLLRRATTRKPPLHFLHLPKTGGTAVKAALQGHERAGRYLLELHGHGTTLADVPPGEGLFFALRDPAARFVSGFYSRQRRGRPRYDIPWSPVEERVFATFPTASAMAEALTGRDREVAEAGMGATRHFRPVVAWFGSVEALQARQEDLVAVLFQDRLDEDFAALKVMLGLEVRLPHDDVNAHRNPAAVDRSLSPLAVENLRRWYAEDYALLDWCRTAARPRLPA